MNLSDYLVLKTLAKKGCIGQQSGMNAKPTSLL